MMQNAAAVAPSRRKNVIIATTVMLSFISFWRASAIILADLGSSAYYAGGIAEHAIGKSAPWFILGIMLFSYAVRAIYIESCSMFVRGGVYKVVHEAMGGMLAKFSVSALMFDYVLTGPISAVSAGLYLGVLMNDVGSYFHIAALNVSPAFFAVILAVAVTLYFWRKNVIGVHESSEKALRIMQITTVMVVTLIIWCVITILKKGFAPVPLPMPSNLHISPDSLGWLKGTIAPSITFIVILIGLGHSLLAMSGEESLAQVNREIEYPKLKNLKRTGLVIFLYSLLFTSLVSFFAVMIIPDAARANVLDNLIGGLSMFLVGPLPLRLLFHGFVVVVGTLILSGAVNTSIFGSNGVLNRVAEDGVLPDWFRRPHKKYGTSYRLINLVVILQIATIIISRGDLYLLGEAYAFGVVWSFAMKALSVLILRYKRPGNREWKVPLNFNIGKIEIPVGLGMTTLMLFALAVINVLTKKTATIAGMAFSIVFFLLFTLSERHNRKKRQKSSEELEKFNLHPSADLTVSNIRPGNVLVAVRNPNRLFHLERILKSTDTDKIDIVVLTVTQVTAAGSGEHGLTEGQIFSRGAEEVFSHVVSLAEKEGKHVELMVVPGINPYAAIMHAAQRLKSSRIVMAPSMKINLDQLGKAVGSCWEKLPKPRPSISLEVVANDHDEPRFFNLGPHQPQLWPEDSELLHKLWLELGGKKELGADLHHRDILRVALRRINDELRSGQAVEIKEELRKEMQSTPRPEPESGKLSEMEVK